MPAFNARVAPKEIVGLPAPIFYYGLPALIAAGIAVVPEMVTRIVFIPAAIVLAIMAIHGALNYEDSLLRRAKRLSKQEANAYDHVSLEEF